MSTPAVHAALWQAIDDLAARNGCSASGLAIRAGLDATCLNKSKRTLGTALRWPSTVTLARLFDVTGDSFDVTAILAARAGE